jgi:hypothetical protein
VSDKRHSFQPLLFAAPAREPPPKRLPPPLPPPRKRQESHVRLSARAAPPLPSTPTAVLDDLCEDQMSMTMSLSCLERLASEAPPVAQPPLRERIDRLGELRDRLAALNACAVDRNVHVAFAPDAPLADYLRGAYAWGHAVVRALDDLAARLCRRRPDWAAYRWRIEEAKNFHFDELRPQIRADIAALAVVSRGPVVIRDAVEAVFAAADALQETLDRRFA